MKRILLAASISLAVAQGFYLIHWFDRYNQSNRVAMAFESNRVEIARLDEVLTMSARIHAATGQPIWRDRYFEHVEPLREILKETIDLAGSEKAKKAISSVSDANDRLIAMEVQAFSLATEGELAEAFALLTSADYETQKTQYQLGLGEALQISQASIGSTVDFHRSLLILGVIAMFISLLILTELWRRLSVLEQRDVAQKISRALKHERKLHALHRQFVSMVSHEFRTPLAIIDGTAQRLERQKEALTRHRVLHSMKTIRKTIARLTGLMENVFNLAQLEEGRIETAFEAFDLASLISKVVAKFRVSYPDRTLSMALDHTPSSYTGDPKLLSQAISNLVSNALKYSEKERPVHLEVYSEAGEVAIVVHDRGRGIAPEDIENIGQRFFRAGSSEGIPGSGIGLHLAKQVIELHGGRLEIQSRINLGSTFTIYLPQNVSHRDFDVTAADDVQDLVPLTS